MSLDQAACTGRVELFSSMHLRDHKVAARFCEVCPAIEACRDLLHQQQSPEGTWAGVLVGLPEWRREQRREVMERAAAS